MLENRPVTVIEPSPAREAGVEPPKRCRARLTNDPMSVRANRNTARGRRVADLFRGYMRALGNPADAVTLSNILAAAELKAAAEDARAKLLAGEAIDIGEVVKIEGAAARAERKLGIERKRDARPLPSLAELMRRTEAAP